MKNVLAIIQARMGSSRLPGKMAAPLYDDATPLEIMLPRLAGSRTISRTVVATTTLGADDVLDALCGRIGVPCFRGSAEDVLDRYYAAYLAHGPADAVVRLTGDNPFCDPKVVDMVVERLFAETADYAGNALPPTFPTELDAEAFTPRALETAWREARLPSEREHVTQFMRNHGELFRDA